MRVLFYTKQQPKNECGCVFTGKMACVSKEGAVFVMPLVEAQIGILEIGSDAPNFNAKMFAAYSNNEFLRLAQLYAEEMDNPNADEGEALLNAIDLLDAEIAAYQAELDRDAIDDQINYSYTLLQS